MNKKILLIFLFAFLIRLLALNQSLWLDEATTAKVVKEYGFSQIISRFSPNDFHPPLYYLLMKIWTNIFGYSEIALRFPSIIFSLLTGWVVYLIGGLWAAVFFLFNPLIVYYSQEARMYMMVTFLLTAGLYFFLGLISKIKNQKSKIHLKNQIFFNLFIILGFLTFYGSIFFIIPMLLYLLYKKQYKFFFASCSMLCVTLILLSPLIYQQIVNAKVSLKMIPYWSLVLGKATLKNLLLIPLKFSFGRISFYPKWLYWLISGVWMVFVWFFVIRGGMRNKKIMIIIVITIILGLLFSFYSPLLQYFRFLYLISMMSILLASGITATIFRIIVVTGFFILSLAYLLIPQFHREDWRSLAKSLPKGQPVYMIVSSSDPLRYYQSTIEIFDLKVINNYLKTEKQLTIIPYTAEIYGIKYSPLLLKNNFYLEKTVSFRGLILEFWKKKT